MASPDAHRRFMAAVAGICALTANALPAAEPFAGRPGGAGFHGAVTDSLDDRGPNADFDLGIEIDIGVGWMGDTSPPVPLQTGVRIVPPAGMPEWTAQLTPAAAGAQTPSSGAEEMEQVPEKPYGWKQLRYDINFVAHKPARLDAKGTRRLVVVAGTTALLYVFRKDIQKAWHDNSSEGRTDFLNSARVMGGAAFAPAVALAAWGASFATHNQREKETAQLVLESMALSSIGSGVGSFVLAAERPEDGNAIKFFALNGHGVSFDVSIAAAVIPPLRRQYLRVRPEDGTGRRIVKYGLTALLYSGMAITALQRIDANKHWAPDVFLGMVNGLTAGRVLGQAHDEARERRSRLGFSALPGGLAVTWTVGLDPR